MQHLLAVFVLSGLNLSAASLSISGKVDVQQNGPPPSLGTVTPCNQNSNCVGFFSLLPGTTIATQYLSYTTNANNDSGNRERAVSGSVDDNGRHTGGGRVYGPLLQYDGRLQLHGGI